MTTDDGRIPEGAARLRMATALAQRHDVEGGYAALARSIRETYVAAFPQDSPGVTGKGNPRDVVDRRKLAAIVEATEELVFTTRELRAIDLYLERYGQGLSVQPLFEKHSFIQTLAQSGTVTFLLGSRPGDEAVTFPYWDVLAMAEVQRRLTAMKMPVAIDIQEVPMAAGPEEADAPPREGDPEVPAWHARFASERTLVCLGSNRLNPASERMLRGFFALDRIRKPLELPFHFVWNERLHAEPSQFKQDASEIEDAFPTAAEATRAGHASALVLPDGPLLDTLTGRKIGDGYGLCVAQRREDGTLWVLIAGVSGPATYATACLLDELPFNLAGSGSEARSPVWWSAVRATVPAETGVPIERMRDLKPTLLATGTWEPPDGLR